MIPLANFIFEMGMLSRVPHCGYWLINDKTPKSVAEHSLRAAQIGFALAVLEGNADPNEVAAMLVFHDMAEARTGDVHKVANRYLIREEARAAAEQTNDIGPAGEQILSLWNDMEERQSEAAIIAKDADYLEMAFTAKEYQERGYQDAEDWITNVGNALKTESAKQLWQSMQQTTSTTWWHGLKRLDSRKS